MNIHAWEDGTAGGVDSVSTFPGVPAITTTSSSAMSGVSSAEAQDIFAEGGGETPPSHGGRISTMTREYAAATATAKHTTSSYPKDFTRIRSR